MQITNVPMQEGGPDHKGYSLGNFNLALGPKLRYATNNLPDPEYITKQ